FVAGDVQHGDGLEVPEKNGLLLCGISCRLVADLLRWGRALCGGNNGKEKDCRQQWFHGDPLIFRKLSITYACKAAFSEALGDLSGPSGQSLGSRVYSSAAGTFFASPEHQVLGESFGTSAGPNPDDRDRTDPKTKFLIQALTASECP